MKFLVRWLIAWPQRVAGCLAWLAPLFARITVGWVFLWSGWGKLNNLPQVIENFVGWGIPLPGVLAPFVGKIVDRSHPRPVKFTGRLIPWYAIYRQVNARKGQSTGSCNSNLSWLMMRQLALMTSVMVR